ncbi:rod shape-determining protein MreD [Caldichromatium japonicum]|uniref:Rod shape-determining protein MreD n=1 Tax=Caldichromatium japonicum TaxID=2699430 RepID=A0A6G7VAE8_9GAMM|nr:rod shape-determining protein MreD [Caldichromatium japonicum]QIK36932.1 rod shape-determining protein MreD [Caldichromatium japonicum]
MKTVGKRGKRPYAAARQPIWPIALSLILALYLTILPIASWPWDYRPPWVVLTILFWCFATPRRVGIFTAFILGLLLDVLTGTLLGQHALSLSVTAYLALVVRPRIRIFPPWQQAFFVALILLSERLLTLWIIGATGQTLPSLTYWFSALAGLACWPILAWLLTPFERRLETP